MIHVAIRPPSPTPQLSDADKAALAAQRNACQPLEIASPAASLRPCEICPQHLACQHSLRTRGRLFLDVCEGPLSRGYGRDDALPQDALERGVLAALADGGWLLSTAIYNTVLPDRDDMTPEARARIERRLNQAITRLQHKQLIEKRIPQQVRWLREYRLREAA